MNVQSTFKIIVPLFYWDLLSCSLDMGTTAYDIWLFGGTSHETSPVVTFLFNSYGWYAAFLWFPIEYCWIIGTALALYAYFGKCLEWNLLTRVAKHRLEIAKLVTYSPFLVGVSNLALAVQWLIFK